MTLEELAERVEALEVAVALLVRRLDQASVPTLEEQHQRWADRLRLEKTEAPGVL